MVAYEAGMVTPRSGFAPSQDWLAKVGLQDWASKVE